MLPLKKLFLSVLFQLVKQASVQPWIAQLVPKQVKNKSHSLKSFKNQFSNQKKASEKERHTFLIAINLMHISGKKSYYR